MSTENHDEQPCPCPIPADALRAALEGRSVPRCEVHQTFGYEPPGSSAMALNSDDLEKTILRRLSADDENTFTSLNQPNI